MKNYRPVIILFLLFTAAVFAGQDQLPEHYYQAPVVEAGLFKNNLAFVTRSLKIPAGAAVLYVKGNPAPIHGTLWWSFPGSVNFNFKEVTFEKEEKTPVKLDVQILLSQCGGKTVNLYLSNDEVISGTILDKSPPIHGYLFIKTKKGKELIQTSRIWRFTFEDSEFMVKSQYRIQKSKLKQTYFQISVKPGKKDRLLRFSYLTNGAIWAPSYKLDLFSKTQGELAMKAVIKNEITGFKDVEISLISGFPAILFAHARSLVNNKIHNFINQLNQDPSRYRRSSITHQAFL